MADMIVSDVRCVGGSGRHAHPHRLDTAKLAAEALARQRWTPGGISLIRSVGGIDGLLTRRSRRPESQFCRMRSGSRKKRDGSTAGRDRSNGFSDQRTVDRPGRRSSGADHARVTTDRPRAGRTRTSFRLFSGAESRGRALNRTRCHARTSSSSTRHAQDELLSHHVFRHDRGARQGASPRPSARVSRGEISAVISGLGSRFRARRRAPGMPTRARGRARHSAGKLRGSSAAYPPRRPLASPHPRAGRLAASARARPSTRRRHASVGVPPHPHPILTLFRRAHPPPLPIPALSLSGARRGGSQGDPRRPRGARGGG